MMAYLKWILLLVCVAYVVWPLLSRPRAVPGKERKRP